MSSRRTCTGFNVLLNVGQQTVSSGIASIFSGLIPLLTIGFAKVFLPQEAFGVSELFGVVLGSVGLAVITQPDVSNLLTADTVGQLILVLAAGSFALGGVLTQWVDAELSFAPRTAWAMLVGAVLTDAASFASPSEALHHVQSSVRGVLTLAFLGVFVSAISYLIYFELLERLGSVELNLVTYGAAIFRNGGQDDVRGI